MATQPWHKTPEAQTLLADCIANPPRFLTRVLQSHERWSVDDATVSGYDLNDDRVDALRLLSDRAYNDAVRGLDVADVRKITKRWATVDSVIAAALVAADVKVAA